MLTGFPKLARDSFMGKLLFHKTERNLGRKSQKSVIVNTGRGKRNVFQSTTFSEYPMYFLYKTVIL